MQSLLSRRGCAPARQPGSEASRLAALPAAQLAPHNGLSYCHVPAAVVAARAGRGRPAKRATLTRAAEPQAPPATAPAAEVSPEEANAHIAPEVVVAEDADAEKLKSGGSGISSGIRLQNVAMTFKNQQVCTTPRDSVGRRY